MDIISINKLKSYCIIGVNEKERLKKQEIFVDTSIHLCYFGIGYLSRDYEYDKSNCQLYEVLSYS